MVETVSDTVLEARTRLDELARNGTAVYNTLFNKSLASALTISSYNTLDSFDMVYSLSETSINSQLKLLNTLGMLPKNWQGKSKGSSVDATFGTPSVDFNTGDSMNNKVKLMLPIQEGTVSIASIDMDKDGNPVIVKSEHKLNGATFNITTNIALTDVAKTYKSDKNIPKEVSDQLKQFSNDMFCINKLFLNFEDVNLITDFSLTDISGVDMSDNNVVSAINCLVEAFINGLKATDNPYIAGYSITDKSKKKTDSTWNITGVTYNIFPDPTTATKSTLNYLMVIDNEPVPTGNVGIFHHSWISNPSQQGVFVIAQKLVMSYIIAEVARIMKISPASFRSGDTLNFVGSTNNSEGGTTTCTVGSVTNSNTIQAQFHNTFRKTAYDKLGSNIGYVDGYVDFTTTLTFNIDSKTGQVTISSKNSDPVKHIVDHPNFLGSLEKILATIADAIISAFTFGQVNNVFNQMVNSDWNISVGALFNANFTAMKSRIVLPAGGTLMFKDIAFYNEGSMLLSTTISN